MSAKITAPVEGYNGESAGVKFEDGIGYTDDPRAIEWLQEKGYEVEEVADEKPKGKAKGKAKPEPVLPPVDPGTEPPVDPGTEPKE